MWIASLLRLIDDEKLESDQARREMKPDTAMTVHHST